MGRLSRSVLISFALGAIAAVGLAGPAAAQVSYPPSGPTIVVSGVSANIANVSCAGFRAGAQITVTAGVVLGTVTANAAGTCSQNFTIPCSIGNGTHTVSASGIAANGTSQTVSTQIVLSNCAVSTGKLAFTGSSSTFPFVAAGVGLVLVGSVLTVGMRRRRSAHTLKV
jgi:LPXTG-motif cell wall-anchored protein